MLSLITGWGWRELRQPTDGRIRRALAYGADNGAYADSVAGRPPTPEPAIARLIRDEKEIGPASLAVVPDIVAGGMESLHYSVWWAQVMAATCESPRYLAVQDGQGENDVIPLLQDGLFDGVFIGGSTSWKWSTAARWVVVAHDLGKLCHIGRASSARRVRYARAIGADSADSNGAVSSYAHAWRFYRALQAAVYSLPPPTEAITRTHAPVSRYSERQLTLIEVLDVPVA